MPNEPARGSHRLKAPAALIAACLMLPAASVRAAGGDPLSAIDWLSQSVSAPANAAARPKEPARPDEPPVSTTGALPVSVATIALDGPTPDGAGLIAPAVSGLPRDLWGTGLTAEIGQAITRNRMDSLPALRQLLLTMLLAEAAPPVDSTGEGQLLQIRIDKLLQLGAVEQAAALIAQAGVNTPGLFRREFDVALLTGNEDRACAEMLAAPGLAPTLTTRVFCLARSGDWDAAALTLATARALDQIPPLQADLLARFLDPDLFEGELAPPPPSPVTPLDWKIYEAVGESLPTASLPVAFAWAELGQQSGWKARIEATERLTRAGTIAPNMLLGLYTERSPAASGGVWDRVDAFQRFDSAMRAGHSTAVLRTLPIVWAEMQEAELEVPFAMLYGEALQTHEFEGEAGTIVLDAGLLSPAREKIARVHQPRDPEEAFLIALAIGDPLLARAPNSLGRAIQPAFAAAPALSEAARGLIDQRRLGEAILLATEEIARGVEGDLRSVSLGLGLLRSIGLEQVARRTALELMLLERRG